MAAAAAAGGGAGGETTWRVVGGEGKGGIVVRAGQALGSAQLPERLSTGALVRQADLVGERLSYRLLSGDGPAEGWVSLKLKDKELLVKAEASSADAAPGGALSAGADARAPALVCFYSGGCSAPQGRRMLAGLLARAGKEGFSDTIVLDHVGEPGFESCKDWDEYVDRLHGKLEADAKFRGRRVFVVAHSHGALPAYGLAKRLGPRCLKLYPVARRPPGGALLDDVWGVDSGPKLAAVDDADLLRNMLDAWPNKLLERFRNQAPLPAPIKDVLDVVRRQYSSPVVPCGSADAATICGGDAPAPIEAPILAVAAGAETAAGETAEKMSGWEAFTQQDFQLRTVEASHMEVLGDELFDLLFDDMKSVAGASGASAR